MSRTQPMTGRGRATPRPNSLPHLDEQLDSQQRQSVSTINQSSLDLQVEQRQAAIQPIAHEYSPHPYYRNSPNNNIRNPYYSIGATPLPPSPARFAAYNQQPYAIEVDSSRLTLLPENSFDNYDSSIKRRDFPIPKYETVSPEYWSQGSSRRYCCCFQSRRGCCATICCFLLVFLGLLGIAGYLLYPRIPVIQIGFPSVAPNTTAILTKAPNGTLTEISIDVLVNFTIASQNNWDYFIDKIDAKGNLLDIGDKPIDNAYGFGQMKDVTVPANTNLTYTMPLTVYWKFIGLGALTDRALVTLTNCTLLTPPQTFKADYHIVATLPLVSWTGYSMKVNGFFSFNILNLPRSSRNQILSLVSDILESVQT